MNHHEEELEIRKKKGILRVLPTTIGQIDFLSNDYLGIAKNEIPISAKSGSTGSRLLSGNSSAIESLENDIAKFHGGESALLFGSGYAANVGMLSCIAQRNDTLLLDEFCHASIIDGARLSHAKRWSFKHNDLVDLFKKLELASGNVYIVVEAVYSMDGDFAPLNEILQLAGKHDAKVIVDEAHSIGVFGKDGRGYSNELALEKQLFARVITYGKAMGTYGAAIVGSRLLKSYLVNFSRPFIYSTAPSPHQVKSILKSYEQLLATAEERIHLKYLINYWENNKVDPSFGRWVDSKSPIQSLIIPDMGLLKLVSEKLMACNFWVKPIKSPTVKIGSERIRFCIHAFNTIEEIELLFQTMKQIS